MSRRTFQQIHRLKRIQIAWVRIQLFLICMILKSSIVFSLYLWFVLVNMFSSFVGTVCFHKVWGESCFLANLFPGRYMKEQCREEIGGKVFTITYRQMKRSRDVKHSFTKKEPGDCSQHKLVSLWEWALWMLKGYQQKSPCCLLPRSSVHDPGRNCDHALHHFTTCNIQISIQNR